MSKEVIKLCGPPSDEQKCADRRTWLRDIARKLVHRRTLLVAIRFLSLTVRVMELVKRLYGDI